MTLKPTDLPEEAAETHPELNHERGIPRPVRWLLVITLVVLLLFCCGQMALWNPLPIGRSDTRSKLSADYGPWPFIRIAVVNPDILDDLVRDLAHEGGTGTPSIPQLGPQVDIWSALGLENAPTNTSVPPTHTSIPPTSTGVRLNTPTPTRTRAPTASPTLTRTPTRIFIPTRTPTGLSTAASTFTSLPPPTSTQPNTPVVVPTNINPPAPTATLSPTVTLTDTPTITATPTVTPTPTVSATSTTPTPTVTATPTATPTLTNTPVPCSGSNPGGLNIGGPDDSVAEIGCGQFIIVDLGSGAIDTTTPDATYDFIQYERAAGSGVLLDWVITEISADPSGACGISATWLPILNWGDGNSGNNGNVPASYLPEIDNRDIFSGDLYASTGIAVDLEALGIPAGVYPCVRISSPLNGDNDPAEVDSIQILNP